jgi:hypothetical protein
VDIIIEHMFLFAGNKLTEFISSLFCIHFICQRLAHNQQNKCGIWNCMFSLKLLTGLVYQPVDWDSSTWEDGSESNKLSFLLDAPCSS